MNEFADKVRQEYLPSNIGQFFYQSSQLQSEAPDEFLHMTMLGEIVEFEMEQSLIIHSMNDDKNVKKVYKYLYDNIYILQSIIASSKPEDTSFRGGASKIPFSKERFLSTIQFIYPVTHEFMIPTHFIQENQTDTSVYKHTFKIVYRPTVDNPIAVGYIL